MSRFQYILQSITLSLTRKALLGAIFLTTALLTLGYLMGQLYVETPVVFLVGILWIACTLRDLHWASSPLFLLLVCAAAIGYMANLSHILMLAAGCTNLIAWDLHNFEARLLDLENPATHEMEKSHLMRVWTVIAASFLLIAIDNWLQIRFQFIVLVLVTVLAIFILNQTMLSVRNSGKPPRPKQP